MDDVTGSTATDLTPAGTAAAPAPLATAQAPVRDRGARRWLVVLSVIVGLLLLLQCGSLALAVGGFGLVDMLMMSEETAEDDSADVEASIRSAFGEDLESVSVRRVKVDYGAPFPFSILEGGPTEYADAVEYRLKGVDVLCAGVMSTFVIEPSPPSMIPPRAALRDRMEKERFVRLLAAFAEHTDAPFGGLTRYTSGDYMMSGTSLPATITVDGKEYGTVRMWMAVEGEKVEGDSYESGDSGARDALVFYEDPKTGAFEYLGVEPFDGMFW